LDLPPSSLLSVYHAFGNLSADEGVDDEGHRRDTLGKTTPSKSSDVGENDDGEELETGSNRKDKRNKRTASIDRDGMKKRGKNETYPV
jgi:hypothetical protein